MASELIKKLKELIKIKWITKSKGDYYDFREAIGERESGGNYYIVNDWGFLGKYQFGKPRLYDLGYSVNGWHPSGQNLKQFITIGDFLTNRELQDDLFLKHVTLILRRLRKEYKKAIRKYTESGLVAGVHLKGLGGLKDFLNGNDNSDGYGTKISEYINKFAGYDLSEL